MDAPNAIRITDVSPRDGLQNEPGHVPTADKLRLIHALADARVDEIEITSFVSGAWVPQLGDAEALLALLAGAAERPWASASGRPTFSALVPNERGLERALTSQRAAAAAGMPNLLAKVSVFTAASETFAQRNTNATIAQTLERFTPVVRSAHDAGLLVRGYISCAVACPFEGPIAPNAVADVARRLLDLGVDELDIADTIGVATPEDIARVLDALARVRAPRDLTLHLHDTFGRAGACVARAIAMGVRSFDSAAGGLGGCPYAGTPERRAPGNIDTAELLAVARAAGLSSRVDPTLLAHAGTFARSLVQSSARRPAR